MNEKLSSLLERYLTESEAELITSIMIQNPDIPIVIEGKQGPTGKTTLCKSLNALGYKAYEIFNYKNEENDNQIKIIISLNKLII